MSAQGTAWAAGPGVDQRDELTWLLGAADAAVEAAGTRLAGIRSLLESVTAEVRHGIPEAVSVWRSQSAEAYVEQLQTLHTQAMALSGALHMAADAAQRELLAQQQEAERLAGLLAGAGYD